MKKAMVLFVVSLALTLIESAAGAVTVVVPNGLECTEGSRWAGSTFSFRVQQVFPSSQFDAVAGPHWITRIAWRPDGERVTVGRTVIFNHALIRLSTKRGRSTLVPAFAENIGGDETTVHDGLLELTTANSGSPGRPKSFDYVIELQRPFLYDPGEGHLLLDFQTLSGSNLSLDSDTDSSRLGRTLLFSCDPEAPVAECESCIPGGGCFHSGLVTQFEFCPGPTWALDCNGEAITDGNCPSPPRFLRGDCNDDGTVDISDAVSTFGSLFLGEGDPDCDDACDSNDDGTVDISDAIATLGVLFLGNGAIPLPGMTECGVDSTEDGIDCDTFDRCP